MKNPALAALWSCFLPGAGQLYNGQKLKAIVVLIVQLINLFWMAFYIGFLLYPIVWLWSINEAYRASIHLNRHYNSGAAIKQGMVDGRFKVKNVIK